MSNKTNNRLEEIKERAEIHSCRSEGHECTRKDRDSLLAAVDTVLAVHHPKRWTEYNIPVFDEFDKSTQVHEGCSCGSRYYPCPTVAAIYNGLALNHE